MVTGIDLIKEQIRVCAGEKLSIKQSDIIGGVGVAGYLLILLWAWFGLPGV